MAGLPAITKDGATVTRIAVPAGLAFVAAMFPDFAGAMGLAGPFLAEVLKRKEEKASLLLEEALRRGDVVDLSANDLEAFVPMAYRFVEAARQGEYDRNLRLLGAFLTAELKAETCQSGSFLDMAKRVEGLSVLSLRAVATIGLLRQNAEAQGRCRQDGFGFTASKFKNLDQADSSGIPETRATDALADLSGRGFLYASSLSGYGGSEQHFSVTQPLDALLSSAFEVAREEAHP